MTTKTSDKKDIYTVSYLPQSIHITEIEAWLLAEESKTKEGFYCNWRIIYEHYQKQQFAVLLKKSKPIGFAIWNFDYGKVPEIKIIEIKPTYRKKGLGRLLVENILNFLRNEYCVVIVECSPHESESFWKKLGFQEFPQNHILNTRSNKHLFITLLPNSDYSIEIQNDEVLEMWDEEPCIAKETNPVFTWNLDFKDGTRVLTKPIIQPSHYEWRLRWRKGDNIIKDGKIKYYGDEIDNRIFTMVTELPIY